MKEYVIGIHKYIVIKNDKGLYDYQTQEYSNICNCWVNLGKHSDFTKDCLQDWLEIEIDF